jgi:hypothetical protein
MGNPEYGKGRLKKMLSENDNAAQQSVRLRANTGRVGILRLFKHFSRFRFFLPVERVSVPSHPPVTQTVGRLRNLCETFFTNFCLII